MFNEFIRRGWRVYDLGAHETETRHHNGEPFEFVKGSDLLIVRAVMHEFVFTNTKENRAIVRNHLKKRKA